MSDGFAIPSDSDDLPPAEKNHLYDYDLYGSPSDAAAHAMEVDDTSNGSTDPVLPLDTQSCFFCAKHSPIALKIEKWCFREKSTLEVFDFKKM